MTLEEGPRRPSGGYSILAKLKWLTGVRLLLASTVLGSAFVLDLHEHLPFPTGPLYGLLGLTFGLSLLYAVALRTQRRLLAQGLTQLALDVLLVSLLVHLTGGLDSVFAFLYIFVIFAAANLLEGRGSLVVALLCGALYGALVVAEWTRIIPPVEFAGGLAPLRPVGYAVYQVLIHTVAFVAVAILSSHLVTRLRQTGQELERRGTDLRNLRTLHQSIVANISSGIMTLDMTGRIVSFNQAAQGITGYDLDALRDRPWQETPFSSCPLLAEFYAHPEIPLRPPLTEITLQRRDGNHIPVGIACSPLRGALGEPVGLVAIFQDLTERKRVEERLRRADRLAALGQLAASIAHEIRNPLAAISGSVEVLREELAPTGENRELLEIILRETDRLKLITGQFLDFAKPRPPLFRPCALRPLLDETLQLLEKSGQRHPATSWEVLEEQPNLQVLADADQLRQVIWNVCLNAVESMSSGGKLTITLHAAPAGGRLASSGGTSGGPPVEAPDRSAAEPSQAPTAWVEMAFRDTGQGIPPQELDRIFDPFYTTRASGTGLGLAIALKIVESMGGQIGAESQPDSGSVFRVRLPQAPAGGAPGGVDGRPPRVESRASGQTRGGRA